MKTFSTILFVLLVNAVALSQIPRTLSYQGMLTDSSGNVKPDGSYSFTFKLYDASTAIWEETKTLQVKNGLFSTALGDATPFGAAVKFDKQYLLGIKVGSEPELTPRIPLTSVAYSLNASLADTTWLRNGSDLYFLNGNVGIGTTTPRSSLSIYSQLPDQAEGMIHLDVMQPFDGAHRLLTASKRNGADNARLDWTLEEQTGDTPGLTILRAYRPTGLNPEFLRPFHVNWDGRVGIGTTVPVTTLQLHGQSLWLTGGNGASLPGGSGPGLRMFNDGERSMIFSWNYQDGSASMPQNLVLQEPGGNVGIGILNPTATLDIAGRTKTQVLEITGGSDLAEPFEITNSEMLEPGSVVVIDEENPGKLKLSSEPYDKRVAGVVSGAGGIQPGLTLKQEGVMEGNQNIALSGRVYVLATTENGKIKPGDRLTTSSLPGYAMRVTNETLSPGSVIGKAMSSLNEGEDLVLVLINLQ